MKILTLGDIHGRKNWHPIVSRLSFDKLVFVGDYFDTRESISARQQIDNFKEIVTLKKANPDKVILLFGNHEFHYLPSRKESYSCYDKRNARHFQNLITEALNDNLLQICHVHDRFLFSHAGVTKTWLKHAKIRTSDLETSINRLLTEDTDLFRFMAGENKSNSGDDITQSPLWVRPFSFIKDKLNDFTQVVGHTMQSSIQIIHNVAFVDTLGTSGECLMIENGSMRPMAIHTAHKKAYSNHE